MDIYIIRTTCQNYSETIILNISLDVCLLKVIFVVILNYSVLQIINVIDDKKLIVKIFKIELKRFQHI